MILLGRITAKATLYVETDVKGRRLGERKGLDTLVVRAENDECYISMYIGVSMKVEAFHLKSTVATLELKSLDRI